MTKSAVLLICACGVAVSFSSTLQAQELQEGTWSGTLTLQNQGQALSVEVKKITDPHWRWRAGTEEVLSATLTFPLGQVPLSEIRLEGEQLSYSFTVPQIGAKVSCGLTLQAEGSYDGECAVEGGGGPTIQVTLTPPEPTI